ncbi:hypothetical protein OROMI_028631 [Orobanche minor]
MATRRAGPSVSRSPSAPTWVDGRPAWCGDRTKRRRSTPDTFDPPENLSFRAGGSWADKTAPRITRGDHVFKNTDHDENKHVSLITAEDSIKEVLVDADLVREIHLEWSTALILKIPGKPWTVESLRGRVERLWGLQGNFILADLGRNIFILRNIDPRIREEILTKGPWKIGGLFLAIRKWYPEFTPSTFKVDTAITWVRVQQLPPHFYRESILQVIAKGLGDPIKVDANTFWLERGKFARLCVQVDLSKPLERGIKVNGVFYNVVYENLQTLCYHCGKCDHIDRACPNKREQMDPGNTEKEKENISPSRQEDPAPVQEKEASVGQAAEEGYGPWLLMRRRQSKVRGTQTNPNPSRQSSSQDGNKIVGKVHGREPLRQVERGNVGHSPLIKGNVKSVLGEQKGQSTHAGSSPNRFDALRGHDKKNECPFEDERPSGSSGGKEGLSNLFPPYRTINVEHYGDDFLEPDDQRMRDSEDEEDGSARTGISGRRDPPSL